MTLFRTVAPVLEPVTPAEVEAHLRLEAGRDRDLLAGLIAAAREEVERRTGQALIDQCWRLALDCWPHSGPVLLRRTPVREILAVTVYGRDGGAALLDRDSYATDLAAEPARLYFGDPPRPGIAVNGIEIDFRCGHGESGTEVPDLLKRAMLLLIAHWHEFRGAFGPGDQPVSYPPGFDRLVASFRPVRLS